MPTRFLLHWWSHKVYPTCKFNCRRSLSSRLLLSERIVRTVSLSAQHVSAEHGKECNIPVLTMHARVVLRVVCFDGAYGSVLGGVLL